MFNLEGPTRSFESNLQFAQPNMKYDYKPITHLPMTTRRQVVVLFAPLFRLVYISIGMSEIREAAARLAGTRVCTTSM